jgi:hypothetical protein
VSVRLGARKISPTRRSSNVRAGTTVKLLGSKVRAVSGVSVVGFILSSFRLSFFEGWSVVESGVDAKLFFGRLMAATTAAPPRIILRRDKQLDPSSESADIPDSASFFCVGMFIAISSVTRGSEVECLHIAFLAFLEETNSDITTGFYIICKNGPALYDRDGHGIGCAYRKSFREIVSRPAHPDQPAAHERVYQQSSVFLLLSQRISAMTSQDVPRGAVKSVASPELMATYKLVIIRRAHLPRHEVILCKAEARKILHILSSR